MTAAGVLLAGRKVELRTFTPADITPAYLGWLNDPVTMRLSNQRFLRHDEASSARFLSGFAAGPSHFLAIVDRASNEMVGTMTAHVSLHHGTADMGIMVGARHRWGEGLGQDAWDTLLAWLLQQPGMRKVTAGTLACNTAMLRLMERSGMEPDGVRRAQELVDGRAQDILYFARFCSD